MVVSNINDITMETIGVAIANIDLDNLILNAIKSVRNIKKHPDCSVIYDYLCKSLPNSETNKIYISNRLEYLTNNNALKNKPNSGKDSSFIINEADQNIPDIPHEQMPYPVNFETPSIKVKNAIRK